MPDNPRREARRKAGFRTAAEFAEAIGWHPSSVHNVESGRHEPKPWYDWLLEMAAEKKEACTRTEGE